MKRILILSLIFCLFYDCFSQNIEKKINFRYEGIYIYDKIALNIGCNVLKDTIFTKTPMTLNYFYSLEYEHLFDHFPSIGLLCKLEKFKTTNKSIDIMVISRIPFYFTGSSFGILLQSQIYNFEKQKFTKRFGLGIFLNYNKDLNFIKSKRYSLSLNIRNYYKLLTNYNFKADPSFEIGFSMGFSLFRSKFISEGEEFDI